MTDKPKTKEDYEEWEKQVIAIARQEKEVQCAIVVLVVDGAFSITAQGNDDICLRCVLERALKGAPEHLIDAQTHNHLH